jgi:SAM-dependent methyltransferase
MVDNIWTEFAVSYDRIIPRLHCYRRMRDKILADLSGYRCVIDAGCGTGIISEALVARGDTVHGFDNNPGMLGEAVRKREAAPADQRARWHLSDGDVSAFPTGLPTDADACLLNNVLFYVPDARRALEECTRHLRPGAILVATGPRHRPDARMVFGKAMEEWTRDGEDLASLQSAAQHFMGVSMRLTGQTDEMVTFFQPDELVALLRELGFSTVVRATGDDYYGENFYVAMTR